MTDPSTDTENADSDPVATKAKPISANARRVLGVLVEKAKTTPDNYPMTASALISGCNQKSNRSPQMQLDETDVLNALDELRGVAAAVEIQSGGRVNKYRHAAYDWWGVDSPGAAVMTELTLRGPQTVGEIRTRASRMCPLASLEVVQKVLEDLSGKGLVEPLSPPGRGQIFAHTLYLQNEKQHVAARIAKQAAGNEAASSVPNSPVPNSPVPNSPATARPSDQDQLVAKLVARLEQVDAKMVSLEQRLSRLESQD